MLISIGAILNNLFKSLILIVWLISSPAFANDTTNINIGESFYIDSKILGEKRQILVYLPQSYSQNQGRFPVLYLTDGETHFNHTSTTINFLSSVGNAPEMIVVGVTTTDRNRDLTPTASKERGRETAGGADKFLEFFEDELIPNINKRYRTEPYKVFAGHSLGGLFAINAYLTRPNAFNAYIAVSPSLWWDDGLLLKRAEQAFEKQMAKGTLFISVGNERKVMMDHYHGFKVIMEKNTGPDLLFSSQSFPEENHNSVVLLSHYHGLKKVFSGWHLRPGISLQQALDHYEALTKRFGFTVTMRESQANSIGYALANQQKKFDEAIDWLRWNTRTYPASGKAFDRLCVALEMADKLVEAKTQCEEAIRVAKANKDISLPDFQRTLARVSKKLGIPLESTTPR